jgi:hypothetical protein
MIYLHMVQDKLEKESTSVSRALQELNEKIAKATDESKACIPHAARTSTAVLALLVHECKY